MTGSEAELILILDAGSDAETEVINMDMKPLIALRNFRKKLGLTQREMAQKMGIHRIIYVKTELGYRKPDVHFIRAFKTAFDVTPEEVTRIFIDNAVSDADTSPFSEVALR